MPTLERIRSFDQPGPRYTSYPTADHFSEGFDASRQAWWLQNRADRQPGQPVTVYVHIPFCESICHYCACNRIGTRDFSRAGHYLETLQQEIRLYASHLQKDVRISQLHLGGGTPTFLSDEQLAILLKTLGDEFGFRDDAECSIEVDPRTVDARRLENIRTMGFERISFGVQDLDPAVQQAIHRIQPESMITGLMQQAHQLDFRSINIDLVYGLPRQTLASLGHTLARIADLHPGRMAIYGYAHLPSRFKAQRLIDAADLPDQAMRMQMIHLAISKLNASGYKYIGMDHFALPEDDLAVALAEGRLRRNFMGYTDMPGDDLIGLGVSSISAIGGCYSQNHRELKAWRQAVEAEQLATARGIELQGDDELQREVIMELMCQGRIDFATIGHRFGIDPAHYFQPEIHGLQRFVEAGLVSHHADGIAVTPEGRYFLRSIAMVFDRHGQRRREERARQAASTPQHPDKQAEQPPRQTDSRSHVPAASAPLASREGDTADPGTHPAAHPANPLAAAKLLPAQDNGASTPRPAPDSLGANGVGAGTADSLAASRPARSAGFGPDDNDELHEDPLLPGHLADSSDCPSSSPHLNDDFMPVRLIRTPAPSSYKT